MSSLNTPLWPAGHLPLKGGDWMSSPLSPIFDTAERAAPSTLLISPLEGEMSGRTEGGALAPLFGNEAREETFQ
ncbi:MAG: lytic murein transglycosylase [Mesorhizobium sp.]|nr:MAG: lytic murein transglycosylase [Mesorhizobium sp.]TIW21315.1 MAG: lytic murein transglycosylase [Mesorhizobium sp.]